MINKDKIRNIIELFIAWNGETEPIDVANIDSAVEFISSSLQEEPKFKTGNKVIYLNEEYEIADITDHYILHRIRIAIDGRISVLHLDFDKEELMELVEEPVSEELEEAAKHYLYSNILYDDVYVGNPTDKDCIEMFKAGAKWQKEHLWKPADGDDLPDIDREVIAICKNGRVTFGHRPSEKFIARPIGYGRTEECEIKTYDKGGWNIPNIVYWLDVELPKEIEL